MSETLIGYARCSTDAQDLTAQRDRLHELGVAEERVYLDHGLTGTNRKRPGLDQALAAVRAGDTDSGLPAAPSSRVTTRAPPMNAAMMNAAGPAQRQRSRGRGRCRRPHKDGRTR